MSGVRGNIRNLREFEARLRKIPSIATSERIAKVAAEVLTEKLQESFDSGRTAYNDARPGGVRGPVTLVKTGKVREHLRFGAVGRRIRVVLSTKYAKYLIGRFRILPSGAQAMPFDWSEALKEISRRVLGEAVSGRAQP